MVDSGPLGVTQGNVTRCSRISCWLKHRSIHDPGKCPVAFLDEVVLTSDLTTSSAKKRTGRLGVTSSEEDCVAWLCANVLSNTFTLGFGDVLSHWATQGAVFGNGDVGKALSAALLCPFLPSIELTAWL